MDDYEVIVVRKRRSVRQEYKPKEGPRCDNCDKILKTKKERKAGMCKVCQASLDQFLSEVQK